ncbi:MAG: strawberry notch-like NTP hydrolase domain-containing protein, partial [Stellaceae bacterium]
FSAAISGQAYARHGTTMDTRLTIIDRVPAEDPRVFPPSPGMAASPSDLLAWVTRLFPPRPPVAAASPISAPRVFPLQAPSAAKLKASPPPPAPRPAPVPAFIELAYETREWTPDPSARLTAGLYEGYALQSIHIPGAHPHPTKLVQSAAMAAVAPPCPSYRPHLPPHLIAEGILSNAQLESVIMAGEAHSGHLAGSYTIDKPGTPCSPRLPTPRTRCAFAADGFSAMAPAPARAARSRRSSSTIG